MSGYNGRRGPNVSQYVANLNTLQAQQDLSLAEPINLEEDLAVFTASEFIDWEATGVDLSSPLDFLDTEKQQQQQQQQQQASTSPVSADELKMDFPMAGDFQFSDFPGFQTPIVGQSMQSLPTPNSNYAVPASFTSPSLTSVSPVTPGFDRPLDEPARVAVEEDKRRRNTAASARFRVKKKQREQALEKTAKEMTDRVNMLESKIQQLETENTWLKGLVTEKGASGGKAATSDIKYMLKKRVDQNAGERSSGNRTDGVGTEAR